MTIIFDEICSHAHEVAEKRHHMLIHQQARLPTAAADPFAHKTKDLDTSQ